MADRWNISNYLRATNPQGESGLLVHPLDGGRVISGRAALLRRLGCFEDFSGIDPGGGVRRKEGCCRGNHCQEQCTAKHRRRI